MPVSGAFKPEQTWDSNTDQGLTPVPVGDEVNGLRILPLTSSGLQKLDVTPLHLGQI